MTEYNRAKLIAEDGMKKERVFRFIDSTEKTLLEYIVLFSMFDVRGEVIQDLFNKWQDNASEEWAEEQVRINK